jgi:hypothetical protein
VRSEVETRLASPVQSIIYSLVSKLEVLAGVLTHRGDIVPTALVEVDALPELLAALIGARIQERVVPGKGEGVLE